MRDYGAAITEAEAALLRFVQSLMTIEQLGEAFAEQHGWSMVDVWHEFEAISETNPDMGYLDVFFEMEIRHKQ